MVRGIRILNGIAEVNLRHMAKYENIKVSSKDSAKDIAKLLAAQAEEKSIRMLTQQMTKNDLETICEPLDIDYGEDFAEKKPSRAAYQKRLFEYINDQGIDTFLSKRVDNNGLELIASYVKIGLKKDADLDDKSVKKELVNEIVDAINYSGIEALFYLFDVSFLKKCAYDLALRGTSESKSKLVYAITNKTDLKELPAFTNAAEKREEYWEGAVEAANKEKRPKIKKGITYHDMFQLYLAEELVDWCRENGLKVNGKKPDVIKRILAFLDGDKENTMPQPNRGRSKSPHRKSKKESEKDSKSTKKSKETKETKEKPKKSSKKEDDAEEEEETEEKESKKKVTKDKKTSKSKKEDEEEEQEESSKKSKKQKKDEQEEEEEAEEAPKKVTKSKKEDAEESTKKSKKSKKEEKEDEEEEEEEAEEEKEEEAPKKKVTKQKKENAEEEAPPKKSQKTKSSDDDE